MGKDITHFARRKNVIVRQLRDELLVYDERTKKAHCLNDLAAAVWKLCDGTTTVSEMVRRLEKESKSPVDVKLVWTALVQLRKSGLLLGEVPSFDDRSVISRRALARKMGVAAVTLALPVITSILVPTPAEAASCAQLLQSCSATKPCCPSLQCVAGLCVGLRNSRRPKR